MPAGFTTAWREATWDGYFDAEGRAVETTGHAAPESIPTGPFPEGDATTLSVRIPPDLHARIRQEAQRGPTNIEATYFRLLAQFVEHSETSWPYMLAAPSGSPVVTFRIDTGAAARVRLLAQQRGVGVSDVVVTAVLVHLGYAASLPD